MAQILGIAILSIILTFILIVPFIDFLYKLKLRRQHQQTVDIFNKPTPLFDKFNAWKVGTPFGGGLLIIFIVTILFLWSLAIFSVPSNFWQLFTILFTFISFGVLGFYDDAKKLVASSSKYPFFGLRFRYKFIIQWILALVPAVILYFHLGYNSLFIRGLGSADIGFLYIPFAAFVIVAFANAFNIADGLDGLAPGLLLICLVSFLAISYSIVDQSLGIFIAILIGSVGAFLYFNIYKARIWLGDVGSMSLGACLAIIGLLTGKPLAIAVIGGVFVLEVGSSLIQILGKKFLKKKLLPVAPFHLYFLKRGWDEPKIVMRGWLLGVFFALLGLFLAFVN
ncbi:MAG: hypothetical protein A3B38_01855 [Candidatus Levybacteria bacterium RIFCSPLOWO2_01_FULL_36_13]|nr:MAG: hypothetical protein A2684_03090 [Candidatus Levybacteria bacterium RIFCSPHIGHO2_01_FULL_36_15b]OGH35606.1 MAG: hypothetical protein A3B38_01855 [Candidatus Levybacteria bacterium RIFCSPLOWO2_01_FULL_36_13]